MPASQKSVAERALEAEVRASKWLADANEAREAGDLERAAQFDAKSQFWLDRYNLLSGRATSRPRSTDLEKMPFRMLRRSTGFRRPPENPDTHKIAPRQPMDAGDLRLVKQKDRTHFLGCNNQREPPTG